MTSSDTKPATTGPRGAAGQPTLSVRSLDIETTRAGRRGTILKNITLDIHPHEIVGLIGESGSGKSMLAKAILGMLPSGTRIAGGDILLEGQPLPSLNEREMREVRGNRIAMVPQEPMSAMNPVMRVASQVGEPYVLHQGLGRRMARQRAVELLKRVHIPSAEERARAYPHEFSGGMLQRAMIAMGLALSPSVIIADEPTTALDVTVQDQLLRELRRLSDEEGAALLFVSHDIGVIAQLCDWVYVVYAGCIVESGPLEDIVERPAHPYTQALMAAVPRLDAEEELASIEGRMPSPFEWTGGCRFASRCGFRFDRCDAEPEARTISGAHIARCWRAEARG